MASAANNAPEDILQSVLGQAFSPPPLQPIPVPSVEIESLSPSNETVAAQREPLAESSISSGSSTDSWKAEYEAQIETWREQSAEAREKAEKERERWEAIRAVEKKEAERRKALGIADEPEPEPTGQEHEAGWENVTQHSSKTATAVTESQPSVQLPDASSKSTAPMAPIEREVPRPHSQADTKDGSQKWEDIHSSVTSSYPSLEYPERTETPSPSHRHPAPPPVAPLSATLAVFDSTLTTRTRVKALFSSLAINMLLPFVNGVMLGFGEIFAKNVVMKWFGWKPTGPGYVAVATGINAGVKAKTTWGER
ncbi:hypothetical protein C0991_010744 [Blastosporella zonata]|nr:hypothetical protein C0991_010744 [Blastosporella zonata]